MKRQYVFLLTGALLLTLNACSSQQKQTTTSGTTPTPAAEAEKVIQDVLIDGSGTLFPITEAMAKKFMEDHPDARLTVGLSSSGVGLKKFCIGDTDIANSSRPINKSEIDLCKANGIEYVEVPLAFDGISVMVNPSNDWAACLTVQELDNIWDADAEGKIKTWKQVREAFPDNRLMLYGYHKDAGTYDYFTGAVTGTEGKSRNDYNASEDSKIVIQGIQSDLGSLGFLDFASYEDNKDVVKLVAIDSGNGQCVEPNKETIASGSYSPLSRALFFYVNKESLEKRPAVKAFADYTIASKNKATISDNGFVPLPDNLVVKVQKRLQDLTTGSIFQGESAVGVKLSDQLDKE